MKPEPHDQHDTLPQETRTVLQVARALGQRLRDTVLTATQSQGPAELSRVAHDGPGDTIYAVDRVSEAVLVAELEQRAAALGGIILIAEGLPPAGVALGAPAEQAAYRVLVDPIDGTRGLMYQKRAAWVLIGVAHNRGASTRLSDVEVAVQVEIPTAKQAFGDELWAVRGQGARLERVPLPVLCPAVAGIAHQVLPLRPSQAETLEHGYAMLSRFFPGGRDLLAAIDEEIVQAVLGPPPAGKALCFEDQYASTGGQLYELCVGHDRFNADLRPLLGPWLTERGLNLGLCCHPYDLAASLIATEAGVVLTDPAGAPLDAPLDTEADVAWVGYANRGLQERLQPTLQQALTRRGLLPLRERRRS